MKELVALRHPNRRFARRLFELWDEGLAVLPINPSLPEAAVRSLLEELRPARFEDETGTTEVEGGVRVDEEVALVVPTSGTSGKPKGVELGHSALRWSAQAVNSRLAVSVDRWLACLPLSHIAGIGILMRSLEAGTKPVIHDRFDPNAVARETETTLVSLVPTTLKRLLDLGADLSRYRAVLVGGGPVSARLMSSARQRGVNVIATYGMTETCGGCNYDGFPLQGVHMRTEEEQILVRGPMLMNGYRLRPDLTDQALGPDGWFRTSDRGFIDGSGKLNVLGRLDDVIITGGEKVGASEVADLLKEHPGVADCAVIGVEDSEWGQVVAAAVVPAGDPPPIEELRSWIRQRRASHFAPKRIVFVDEIPRNEAGKLDRQVIRRLVGETL